MQLTERALPAARLADDGARPTLAATRQFRSAPGEIRLRAPQLIHRVVRRNTRQELCVRHAFIAVLTLTGLAATRANAQRLEIGPTIGCGVPLRDQFSRSYPMPSFLGPYWDHLSGRQSVAPLLGLRAAVWPVRFMGVELTGSLWPTRRFVDLQEVAAYSSVRTPATLTSVAVRIALRTGQADRTQFQISAGPQLIKFGGDAFQAPALGFTGLTSRTVWGAGAALAIVHPLSRHLGLRAALEGTFYRVQLTPIPPPDDSTRTPLQFDLAPSIGLVYRIP